MMVSLISKCAAVWFTHEWSFTPHRYFISNVIFLIFRNLQLRETSMRLRFYNLRTNCVGKRICFFSLSLSSYRLWIYILSLGLNEFGLTSARAFVISYSILLSKSAIAMVEMNRTAFSTQTKRERQKYTQQRSTIKLHQHAFTPHTHKETAET